MSRFALNVRVTHNSLATLFRSLSCPCCCCCCWWCGQLYLLWTRVESVNLPLLIDRPSASRLHNLSLVVLALALIQLLWLIEKLLTRLLCTRVLLLPSCNNSSLNFNLIPTDLLLLNFFIKQESSSSSTTTTVESPIRSRQGGQQAFAEFIGCHRVACNLFDQLYELRKIIFLSAGCACPSGCPVDRFIRIHAIHSSLHFNTLLFSSPRLLIGIKYNNKSTDKGQDGQLSWTATNAMLSAGRHYSRTQVWNGGTRSLRQAKDKFFFCGWLAKWRIKVEMNRRRGFSKLNRDYTPWIDKIGGTFRGCKKSSRKKKKNHPKWQTMNTNGAN